MIAVPVHCEPKAYETFCEQLPLLESTTGLVNAAAAVAMHAFPETDLAAVHARIDSLAARVYARVRNRTPTALLAHLHDVLFEEESFCGPSDVAYYDPRNSFLPLVLETRMGQPITLCLVYKAVANCLGIRVGGVNAPFHFLVRIRSEKGWLLVDPFEGGRVYNRREAVARIERFAGRNCLRPDQYLPPATHGQWLRRILDNLCSTLSEDRRDLDLLAMLELRQALDKSPHTQTAA